MISVTMARDTFEIIDERFRSLILPHGHRDVLFEGGRWLEGPVYFGDVDLLICSDIPNNRMLRVTGVTGPLAAAQVSEYARPANFANGNTRDREGRLLTCEHGGRRVVRTEYDGTKTVLADRYQGKRLNSPNDIVVRSDGTIWFTDPDYGIVSDYEGYRSDSEIGANYVYRLDPRDGSLTVVADDFERPNGIAFSPDESILYVSDTGRSHRPDGPHHLRSFRVCPDGSLTGGDVFAVVEPGAPDGFRLDEQGNLWTSAGDGVHCFAPDGTLLGKVKVPEEVSNLCFAGTNRNRLVMTGATCLHAVYVAVRGAALV